MIDNRFLKQIFNHLRIIILFIGIIISCQQLKAQEHKHFFTFNQITETEFKNSLKNNYNAPKITKIGDTTKIESAFKSIEKTYNEAEKELSRNELCESPDVLLPLKHITQLLICIYSTY